MAREFTNFATAPRLFVFLRQIQTEILETCLLNEQSCGAKRILSANEDLFIVYRLKPDGAEMIPLLRGSGEAVCKSLAAWIPQLCGLN